jgi:thymidylate kinase
MRGKFIVVYGANNTGKTTACRGLIESMFKKGYLFKYIKFPIYSLLPTGKQIDNYLRHGNPEGLSVLEIQRIYAQNRMDYQKKLINNLESGVNIISEDYKGTGIAWGLVSGKSISVMERINEGVLEPDLSVVFDGTQFRSGIEKDHVNENNHKRWKKARRVHKYLAKRYGWPIIKSDRSADLVLSDLEKLVVKLLADGQNN